LIDLPKSGEEVISMRFSPVRFIKPCLLILTILIGPSGYSLAAQVAIQGRQLFVDGRPFTIKGVNYSPVPIGVDPDAGPPFGDYFTAEYGAIADRDLPLLRAMGVNTIRILRWTPPVDHTAFLDKAYNNGNNPLYVIPTFNLNPAIYPDISSPAAIDQIKADFISQFRSHKNHPALLMWSIGNDLGAPGMYDDRLNDLFHLVNELALAGHQEEGDSFHPVTVVLHRTKSLDLIRTFDLYTPDLDLWSINWPGGRSFGNLFNGFLPLTERPLLITEFGIDAYDHKNKAEYEDLGLPYQALYAQDLWNEVRSNSVTSIGGLFKSFSDEWWRGKLSTVPGCPDLDPDVQSECGYPDAGQPDGFADEEWWGLMRSVKSLSGPDTLEPRDIYHALKTQWAPKKLGDPLCPSTISFGQTVSCSIDVAGETDTFTFSANSGDRVVIALGVSSGTLDPQLRLYGPDGTLVCSRYSTGGWVEITDCPLPLSGTYTLIANDYGNTKTGQYGLYLQRLNQPGNASALDFGQSVSVAIGQVAEMRTYTFSGNSGNRVLISLTVGSGTLDPQLRLYGPGGTLVCSKYGTGPEAEINDCPLPTSGAYTLLVNEYGNTEIGNYTLYLQRLNDPSGALPLAFDQTLAGTIDTASRMKAYTLFGTAGDNLLFYIAATSGTLDPLLRLYRPDGTLLCSSPTPANGTTEINGCSLPVTGNYTLLVNDYGNTESGDYTLFSQRLNQPENAATLNFGQTVTGTIDQAAMAKTYAFTAQASDRVLIAMAITSGTLDPQLRLYAPGGALVCAANNVKEINDCLLPAAGTYTLIANDYGHTETGGYCLHLQHLNNPGNATALSFGQTAAGAIAQAAEMQAYTFTANASDRVLIAMGVGSGTLDPQLRLYGPDGVLVCSRYSTGGWVEITDCPLPLSGTYTLIANDYGNTKTGQYGLYLQRLNQPGNPSALDFGQTVSVAIGQVAEMRTYTFSADSGNRVLISLAVGSGTLDPQLRLYGPGGTLVCSKYATGAMVEINDCPLPASGAYTLLVNEYGNTEIGNYLLYLQRLDGPTGSIPLVPDQTLAGAIATASRMKAYTLFGTAGDNLLIYIAATSGTLDPQLRLYRPDGTLLCSSPTPANGTTEINGCSLPVTGNYTLLVNDYGNTESGDYLLFIQRLNQPENAATLNFGQTVTGTIDQAAMAKTYTFTAQASDRVLIAMAITSGTLDPQLRLYAPGGALVCAANNVREINDCLLPATGTYTLIANDYGHTETGGYGLHLQRLNNPGNATALSFGQTAAGAIGQAAEMQAYTFNANSGDRVLIALGVSSGTLDPQLRLYGPDGALVCSRYSTGGAVEITDCPLPLSGAYTLIANDYWNTKTGQYGLYLQRFVNPLQARPIGFGQTLSANISAPADMETFIFNAQAGDRVLVATTLTGGTLDPQLRLYGPDGTLTCSRYSTGGVVEINDCPLPTTGAYTLLINDFGDIKLGDFSIYLQRLNDPANANELAFGQMVSGTITQPAEMKTYTFSAKVTDRIWIGTATTSGGLDPYIRIYRPDGTLLCSSYGATGGFLEINNCSVPLTGAYTILAADFGLTEPGSYNLSLQRLNNPERYSPISLGQTITGTIDTALDTRFFTFTATAQDSVLIAMAVISGTLDPQIRLYGPAGILICEASRSSGGVAEIKGCILPASGLYIILANDFGGTETGSFTLSLRQAVSGTLSITPSYGFSSSGDPGGPFSPAQITYTLQNGGDRSITWSAAKTQNWVALSSAGGTLVGGASTTLSASFSTATNGLSPGTYNETITFTNTTDGSGNTTREVVLVVSAPGVPQALPLNSSITISIQPNDALYFETPVPSGTAHWFVLLKKDKSWNGTLQVFKDGMYITGPTGVQDFSVHLPNPEAGNYQIRITGAGTGTLSVLSALPELTLGQWRVGTINRQGGSAWYQVTVPSGQSQLNIAVETIGTGSRLQVFRGTLGTNPQWIVRGYKMNLLINNPAEGTYFLHLTDSATIVGTDQHRDHLIMADVKPIVPTPAPNPIISSFSPTIGGVTGPVTITLIGQNLQSNGTLCLKREGNSDICSNQVSSFNDNLKLVGTFDLSGANPGDWTLVVQNPDGQTASGQSKFNIQGTGNVNLSIDIIGRDIIRTGRPATFILKVRNNGSIDALDRIINLSWPSKVNCKIELPIPNDLLSIWPPSWSNLNENEIIVGDRTFYQIILLRLPPDTEIDIPINLTVLPTVHNNSNSILKQDDSDWDLTAELISSQQTDAIADSGKQCIDPQLRDLDYTPINYNYQAGWEALRNSWREQALIAVPVSAIGAGLFLLGAAVEIPALMVIGGLMAFTPLVTLFEISDILEREVKKMKKFKDVSSISPEDKYGPTGYDPEGTLPQDKKRFISGNQPLAYKIDFWNKESAPAPTQDVYITDQLDPNLDWSSLSFTEIGFLKWKAPLEGGPYFNVDVDLRPDYNLIVNVEGTFDSQTGQVRWEFHSLDPLTRQPPEDPMAGFLPPITNTGYEIGWVNYMVNPKSALTTGAQIRNQAWVKFDFDIFKPAPPNPDSEIPGLGPYLNTIDAEKPASQVNPLAPVQKRTNFPVTWAGSDDDGGSGIRHYTIYVSDNGGPFQPWVTTSATSATYPGQGGHTYSFYSVATDNVGNTEATPSGAQTSTYVNYNIHLPIILK
jgi:uncharacterized protein YfaP (DUF2135 family)